MRFVETRTWESHLGRPRRCPGFQHGVHLVFLVVVVNKADAQDAASLVHTKAPAAWAQAAGNLRYRIH